MRLSKRSIRLRSIMIFVAIAGLLTAWVVSVLRSRSIEPADVLAIEFNPAIPGLASIRGQIVQKDGTVSLGDYGSVYVAGLTPEEARYKIHLHLDTASWENVSVRRIGGNANVKALLELEPFWLSLRVAAMATVLIVFFGLPLALVMARCQFRGSELVSGVLLLPLVLPPTVLGFLLLQVIGRRTIFGEWLESTFGIMLVFHPSGAVIASAIAAFPLFLIPARSAFEAVDPALEDVARLLGRSESSVFLRVTLPLAWRGIASGTVLAFARALGDFGATLMVAGDLPGRTRTASLAIFNAVQSDDYSTAAWMTLLIAAVSIVALIASQKAAPSIRGVRR